MTCLASNGHEPQGDVSSGCLWERDWALEQGCSQGWNTCNGIKHTVYGVWCLTTSLPLPLVALWLQRETPGLVEGHRRASAFPGSQTCLGVRGVWQASAWLSSVWTEHAQVAVEWRLKGVFSCERSQLTTTHTHTCGMASDHQTVSSIVAVFSSVAVFSAGFSRFCLQVLTCSSYPTSSVEIHSLPCLMLSSLCTQ